MDTGRARWPIVGMIPPALIHWPLRFAWAVWKLSAH